MKWEIMYLFLNNSFTNDKANYKILLQLISL